MLFGNGIFMILLSATFITEFFYPRIVGLNGVSFWAFALFHVLEGFVFIKIAFALKKKQPCEMCKNLSRYEFIMTPITALSILSVSAIFPLAERDWLYFLNIGVTGAHILIRFSLILYLNILIRKGEDGFVSIRNHVYIGMSILFVVLNYYVFGIIKSYGVDMHLIFNGDVAGLTEYFLIMSLLEITIGVLVVLQSYFLCIASHFSAKEDVAIDLRTNASISKKLIEKYDIFSYISIFANGVLLVLSIMSAFISPEAYLPLAILYAVVLAVRIPSLISKRRIRSKYKAEPSVIFKKEHSVLLYASIFLVAYSVVAFIFGRVALEYVNELHQTLFMTFGIFVPWSIIKLVLGIRGYFQSLKKGDPLALLNSYIDLILSLFTLAHTFGIIAARTDQQFFHYSAIISAVILGAFCFYIAVRLLVIGIRGKLDKRGKAFENFSSFFSSKQDQTSEVSDPKQD